MAKSPPIPKEQRSFGGRRADLHAADHSAEDRDYNTAERGQSANIRQNTSNQRKIQDR